MYATTFIGLVSFISKPRINAQGDLDGIEGYDPVGDLINQQEQGQTQSNSVSDFFKGYTPLEAEHLETGNYYAQPFVNFIGSLAGFGVVLVVAWMALQTVIDLIYWGVPFTRSFLGGSQQQQQSSATQGFGGMDGLGGGSMYGGSGSGMAVGTGGSSKSLPIFVSVEMTQSMESGQQSQTQSMGGMYGMQPQQQSKPKNVLVTYAKKRIFSLVMLGVLITVLFSSILLDTGINLGAFIIKLIEIFNNVVVSNS